MKKMSKKQLKLVKKMQVNRHGVAELVSPWANGKVPDPQRKKDRRKR